MKTFTQVSQILVFAKDFHRHCEELYRQLRGESDSYPLSLLMEQMGRHEHAMQEYLDRYQHQAPSGVIDTWVQFAPEESPDAIIRNLKPDGTINPEALFAFGKRLDAALINTYESLADDAESEEVRELFAGLLEMIKHSGNKREADEQALRDHMV